MGTECIAGPSFLCSVYMMVTVPRENCDLRAGTRAGDCLPRANSGPGTAYACARDTSNDALAGRHENDEWQRERERERERERQTDRQIDSSHHVSDKRWH